MDAIETIRDRISTLESNKESVRDQLMKQIAGHLRPFDVAINELKGVLIALGKAVPIDVLPNSDLALCPVRPHIARASNPVDMLSGESITADQEKALAAARNKSPALRAAVIEANPVNQLRKVIGGKKK